MKLKYVFSGVLLIILSIFYFLWQRLQNRKDQLPPITELALPFGMNDMENDISINIDSDFKGIKRIVQFMNDTILNIIEYDKSGNEIFKYYKQEVGEFWNGRYITMIAGNIYRNGKVEKTYYFHSNIGFSLISHERNFLKESISVYEIKGKESLINTNPFLKIDTIQSLNKILNHEMVRSLNKIKRFNYIKTRKYSLFSGSIQDFYNSELSCLYKFDSKNRLIERSWEESPVKKYLLNKSGLLSKYFEIYVKKNQNVKTYDTVVETSYHYNNSHKVDTIEANGRTFIYKYNGQNYDEIEYNGGLFMGTTRRIFDGSGYPKKEIKLTKENKPMRIKNYTYKIERYN
jgi:hypothetical protein